MLYLFINTSLSVKFVEYNVFSFIKASLLVLHTFTLYDY